MHEHGEVGVLHELNLIDQILNFEVGVLFLNEELFKFCFPECRVVPGDYILEGSLLHYSIYGITQTLIQPLEGFHPI